MSALVDRLTEVLQQHRLTGAMYCACVCGFSSSAGVGVGFYEQYAAHLAAAVAAELQLTEETRVNAVRPSEPPHWPWKTTCERRWLSGWAAVEDEAIQ